MRVSPRRATDPLAEHKSASEGRVKGGRRSSRSDASAPLMRAGVARMLGGRVGGGGSLSGRRLVLRWSGSGWGPAPAPGAGVRVARSA